MVMFQVVLLSENYRKAKEIYASMFIKSAVYMKLN